MRKLPQRRKGYMTRMAGDAVFFSATLRTERGRAEIANNREAVMLSASLTRLRQRECCRGAG